METINTAPARNFNINAETVSAIEKYTKDLQDLFNRVPKPTEEGGYSGLPGVLERIREVGIDKVFFVGRDYHGKYEDDYCYFTYWDEAAHEFIKDEWGTWAAFPNYSLYEMPIPFCYGWEAGLIDKEAYLNFMKNRKIEAVNQYNNYHFINRAADEYIGLKVSISRGRKWRGTGYLIDTKESKFRFAYPQFRNHSEDFGLATTVTAIIWDPETNTINECNAEYLQFVDQEEIINNYKNWAKNLINNSTVEDMEAHRTCNYDSYELRLDCSMETFMANWIAVHPVPDYSTATYPAQEARDKKEANFKAEKMPQLIEWVKNNTGKQGDEILALAEHIYNKRYGKN